MEARQTPWEQLTANDNTEHRQNYSGARARDQFQMSLLQGLRVVQIGNGLAAAVCGRLLADLGANVCCLGPDVSTPLAAYLDYGKSVVANDPAAARNAIAAGDLIVCEGRPQELRSLHYDTGTLRRLNAAAALV